MNAEFEGFMRRKMYHAQNVPLGGKDAKRIVVKVDDLATIFAQQNRCESERDDILLQWKARHPEVGEVVSVHA